MESRTAAPAPGREEGEGGGEGGGEAPARSHGHDTDLRRRRPPRALHRSNPQSWGGEEEGLVPEDRTATTPDAGGTKVIEEVAEVEELG